MIEEVKRSREEVHRELALSVAGNTQATHSTGVEASVSAAIQLLRHKYGHPNGETIRALTMLREKGIISAENEKNILLFVFDELSLESYPLIPKSHGKISLSAIVELVCAATLDMDPAVYPSEVPEKDQELRLLTFYNTLKHLYLRLRCELGRGNTIIMSLNNVYPGVKIIEQITAFLLKTATEFLREKWVALRSRGENEILFTEICRQISSTDIYVLEECDKAAIKEYWTVRLREFNVDPFADDYVLKEMDKILSDFGFVTAPYLAGEEVVFHTLVRLELLEVPEAIVIIKQCKTLAELKTSGLVEYVGYRDLSEEAAKLLGEIESIPPLKHFAESVKLYGDSIREKISHWNFQQNSFFQARGLAFSRESLLRMRSEFNANAKTIDYPFIRSFFSLWKSILLYNQSSEMIRDLEACYAKLMQLDPSTRTVTDDEIDDMVAGVRNYADAKEVEEGVRNLWGYVFNRIFLHALTHSSETWSERFVELFQNALTTIKNLPASKDHLDHNLKDSSYPEPFIKQMEFLLERRKGKPIEELPQHWCYFPIALEGIPSRAIVKYIGTHLSLSCRIFMSLTGAARFNFQLSVFAFFGDRSRFRLLFLFDETYRFMLVRQNFNAAAFETYNEIFKALSESEQGLFRLLCLEKAITHEHIILIVESLPKNERFAFVQTHWARILPFINPSNVYWVFSLIPSCDYVAMMNAHSELIANNVLLQGAKYILETGDYSRAAAVVNKCGGLEKISNLAEAALDPKKTQDQNKYKLPFLWIVIPPHMWREYWISRLYSMLDGESAVWLITLVHPSKKKEIANIVLYRGGYRDGVLLSVLGLFDDEEERFRLLVDSKHGRYFGTSATFSKVCALLPSKTPMEIAQSLRKHIYHWNYQDRYLGFFFVLIGLTSVEDQAILINTSDCDEACIFYILNRFCENRIIKNTADVLLFIEKLDPDKRLYAAIAFAELVQPGEINTLEIAQNSPEKIRFKHYWTTYRLLSESDREIFTQRSLDSATTQAQCEVIVEALPENDRFAFVQTHWDRLAQFYKPLEFYWLFTLIPVSSYIAMMNAHPELCNNDKLLTMVRYVRQIADYSTGFKNLYWLEFKLQEDILNGVKSRATRRRGLPCVMAEKFSDDERSWTDLDNHKLPLLWMITPPHLWQSLCQVMLLRYEMGLQLLGWVHPSQKLALAKVIISTQRYSDKTLIEILKLFPEENDRLSLLSERGRYFEGKKTFGQICRLVQTKTPLQIALTLSSSGTFRDYDSEGDRFISGFVNILMQIPSLAEIMVLIDRTEIFQDPNETVREKGINAILKWLRESETIKNSDDVIYFIHCLKTERLRVALYFADLIEPDKIPKIAASIPQEKAGVAKLLPFWKAVPVVDQIKEAAVRNVRRAP